MDLNEEQIERYSRHIILSDVGVEGQEKILKGKVLIIGPGVGRSGSLIFGRGGSRHSGFG